MQFQKLSKRTYIFLWPKENSLSKINDPYSFAFGEDSLNIDEFTDIFNYNNWIVCSVDESADIHIVGYGSRIASKNQFVVFVRPLLLERRVVA